MWRAALLQTADPRQACRAPGHCATERAHKALGIAEVERAIRFRKVLKP